MSFTDLSSNISVNGDTTTVTISWSSYTNNDPYDGLSFNQYTFTGAYVIDYGRASSINIKQFGRIALPFMSNNTNAPFSGFAGQITATDVPTIPNNTLEYCFVNSSCSNFGNIGDWNVSNVTNMGGMFAQCYLFNQPLNNWNTSNVTNMGSMFSQCSIFNQPLNSWNVSKVTNMKNMFNGLLNFNQYLNSWDTSSVTDMSEMFESCYVFNGNITSWNTSNVTNMYGMFWFAFNFNQEIGNWDTSNVTDMSRMFAAACRFNGNISNWNTSNVTSMYSMFYNQQTVNSYNTSDFNQPIGNWNTSKVTTMRGMFQNAYSFNQPIDTSGNSWNVSNVTDLAVMFSGAHSFNQPIGKWDTSLITSMYYMFCQAYAFNQDISNWNTSNVQDLLSTFGDAHSFNQPIGNWDISKVTNMNSTFYGATSFNQDISNWNTSNVTNMGIMFFNATSFNKDISNWNTAKVTNMDLMFSNATSFNQPIGNWNFSSVTSMNNFIENVGFTLNSYFLFLINISTNTTINNQNLGTTHAVRTTDYNSIMPYLTNKSISITYPTTYQLILSQTYLSSYTFTITYNSSIVFNGLIVVDYLNNIKYIEDSANPGTNLILFDYDNSYDYNIYNNNNNFFISGTNISSIPYFNTLFPSASEYQLTGNTVNYKSMGNWLTATQNGLSNLSSIPITDTLFNRFKYNAFQLKTAGYSSSELKTAGYSASELKIAGYSDTELIAAGYVINSINGSFIDGYIKNATGQLIDLATSNIITTFVTDNYGNWNINIPPSQIPSLYKIEFLPGGIDILTNQTINTTYSNISTNTDNNISSTTINVTPITTIASNIIETNYILNPSTDISNIISTANQTVASALNISVNDINTDFITNQNPNLLKAAVKINTITEQLTTVLQSQDPNITNTGVFSSIVTVISNTSGSTIDFTNPTTIASIVNSSIVNPSENTLNNSSTIASNISQSIDSATGSFTQTISDIAKTVVATTQYVNSVDLTIVVDSTDMQTQVVTNAASITIDLASIYKPFIFTISNGDFNNSTQLPIVNTGGSFTDLSSNIRVIGDTTTVTIFWTSYTNNNSNDGLSFNTSVVTYGNASSINIIQFTGVPLVNMVDLSSASFAGFSGQITSTDVPTIPNPGLAYCFYNSTFSNFGNIGNWDTSKVSNMDYMFYNANNFNYYSIGNWNFSSVSSIINFIEKTGFWLNGCFSFLTNISNNITISNEDFGIIPGIRTSDYNTIATKLTNKSITFVNIFTYTSTQFNNSGYSISYLKTAGYTASDLKTAGYTTSDLKTAGYSISDILSAGYTASDLKTAGYTASNLKTAGYSISDLKTAGYSISDLKTAGYSISDLKTIGYSDSDILSAGYTASDLKTAGYTASDLKTAGYTVSNLKTAGYTASDLKTAGYSDSDILSAGYTASQLKIAGYTAFDLKTAGYSDSDILSTGYTAYDLKTAGYTAYDLKTAGYTAYDLKTAGYSISDILSAGYSISDLKTAGYTASDLKTAGYSISDLKTAGYSDSHILSAGYTASDLKTAGYTASQLKRAGYSNTDLQNAGYDMSLICFKEDTQILTNKGYIPIQNLRKGDLIKTLKNDYKPIVMIGKREIYHPALQERIKDQLYKCSQNEYPEIFESLCITGCHCILVDNFISEEQKNKTIEINKKIYVTDNKYRLPAAADNRATVYEKSGDYTIYHLALENDDYYMNYGIFANGLLVETCSKRYLKELSNMTLIE